MIRPAKLKWQCRRGLRELDLILEGFLESGYGALPSRDQAGFERLLGQSNDDLFAWLVGDAVPPDQEFAHIVKKVRATALSRRHPAPTR